MTNPDPRLARSAIIDPRDGALLINGQPFPWLIQDGPHVETGDREPSIITIRIPVDGPVNVLPWRTDPTPEPAGFRA